MIRQCLQLCMKFSKVITAPSLHMVKQEQGRHTQWKEEQEKRFDFSSPFVILLSFSLEATVSNCIYSLSFFFGRMENFQVMPVLYQEQSNRFLKY